ncbi:HPP family protein [Natronolimnobius baerhuensis]|uniref:HPP family protein n=1 Tax=Natronolimnobius baerhuensis TaxID=253108 RepID=A0A202E627_9EURY|nr:HPP family protein [Natronolimnobius baerhuensis]OVE83654.1 HPP family protein [Natronolimnobius baerhuensis]
MDDRTGTTLHTGVLISTTAALAWLSGLPLLFPSLGPSAFVLALFQDSDATAPRRVIGGHTIGVVAGLAAYLLFATGISMTGTTDPGSLEGLRLAASGVLATTLTAGGMLATDTRHPPACATTLIVSLGLLSTLLEGAIIILAVVVLVVTHRLLLATERLGVRYTEDWKSK